MIKRLIWVISMLTLAIFGMVFLMSFIWVIYWIITDRNMLDDVQNISEWLGDKCDIH